MVQRVRQSGGGRVIGEVGHPDLAGRTAIVTGAASGLGLAIALAFGKHQMEVALIDRDEPAVSRAATLVERAGARHAVGIPSDITRESSVREMHSATMEALGRVDILINNVGGGQVGSCMDTTLAAWNEALALNLTSAFLCTKAIVPGMVAQNWGRVISISSQLALRGAEDQAAYSAAKAGLHGFTRSIAREFAACGVTANVVAPGPVDTPAFARLPAPAADKRRERVLLNRLAQPGEISAAVVLLASDAGAFFTGATLNISGGDVMT